MKVRNLFSYALVFAFAGSTISLGQATLGVIAGSVTDSSGAVVVGATVSVERAEGGEPKLVTTGPTGDYRVESLTPGTYQVKVTAINFAVAQLSNITVSASVTTPVNVKLAPGRTSETIEVDASVPQVQTETGQIDNVIPTAQIRDLPIATGNPYSLAVTLPGVSQPDMRSSFTNGVGFSVDGLRPRGNNFLIDGFDNNDYGIAGQALQPTNQEAVTSVTVLQNAYAAEYGRGGGSVSNLVYKSGTNKVHGSVWEQYSGSALNAVTAEQQASGLTSAPHQVNNLFGFTVGGPVIKNKLFFFGTSQWTRNIGAPNPPATTLTIPTASGIATLQKLLPNNNVQVLLSSLGGLVAPTASGSVPIGDEPGCIGCSVDFGVFTRSDSTRNLNNEWTARADYQAGSDSVFARFTNASNSLIPDLFANSTALPPQDTQQGGPARNLGIFWSHSFNPYVLNEFRFSAQTIAFTFAPTAATLAQPIAHVPGITFTTSFPNVALGGFEQGTFPQGRQHQTYQFQDAVSIVKRTHSIKVGTDLSILLVQDQIPFNSDGLIVVGSGGPCTFNGAPTTCSDLANYIDDFTGPAATDSISRQFGNPRISTPTNQQAYYFQDSWKIRPNFTLDFGVRYEYQPPDAANVLPFPGIQRGAPLVFQTRVDIKPYRNAWGPRLGFSYSPKFWQGLFGDNKTVIRGGAGVFYDTFFSNISNNTAAHTPNTLGGTETGKQAVNNGNPRGVPQAVESVAAIAPQASSMDVQEPVVNNLRNPRIYQWNLNVQRELPGNFIAQVAYVGTRGTALFANEQFNPVQFATGTRVNPDFGSVIVRANRGDSIYHGLQTEVTRNFGRLSLRGAYTWSRVLDNSSEVFTTTGGSSFWQNLSDPRSDRGPSAFNHTNVASFTWVYALPGPSARFLNQVFGGWETSGSIVLQSGAPETLFLGGFDQNGDGQGNDRPSWGNPKAPINGSPACAFDPTGTCITGIGFTPDGVHFSDIFTNAPGTISQFRYYANGLGQNGNVTRNSIVLPGLEQYNLAVLKNFKMPFGEGQQLQFRGDFLNAFNHFNAGQNNIISYGNLLAPGVGVLGPKSLTLDGGRSIVIWMKYTF
jgi:hypothetical protein